MMRRGKKILSWNEPRDLRNYIRREVRKDPSIWISAGKALIIPLLLLMASLFLSWQGADPGKRLPLWSLPILALGVVGIGAVPVVLAMAFLRERVSFRENGLEHGTGLGRTSWRPYEDLVAFWFDCENEGGFRFCFLCWAIAGEEEEEAIGLPREISKERVRAVFREKGVVEVIPDDEGLVTLPTGP